MKILLTPLFLFISLSVFSQSFRNVEWKESKESVKEKETAIFMDEFSKSNYVEELHYVEFDSGYAYHIHYVFRKDQLTGIKTQKLKLAGNNTKYSALEAYRGLYRKYEELFGEESMKERDGTEQAVKILEVRLADRELFVTVEKKGNEYYLVENIFNNN